MYNTLFHENHHLYFQKKQLRLVIIQFTSYDWKKAENSLKKRTNTGEIKKFKYTLGKNGNEALETLSLSLKNQDNQVRIFCSQWVLPLVLENLKKSFKKVQV